MTTTIIFIRHGLTDWNREQRWQGHEDIPLNEEGMSQARALSRRISSWPIHALYSSDLLRASQTAAIVAVELNLKPILKKTWRERDVGRFQGLTREQIKTQYPIKYSEMQRGFVSPPDGENNNDLSRRAESALNELLTNHPGQQIAVVSHGAILQITLLHVLGLPGDAFGRLSLSGNTGISIVQANNGRLRLTCLNDTAHLE
ncbi:MAG: histidine phosphatase family protein [Candidatus Promineifilaceae bacterium]|nr:histidine phosphatase family protein [Candidatus Promineifilaceae bacterium]